MTHREKIGLQIAELRKKRGLNTRQLAELCGVTFSNINRIERGKYNVSIDILQNVCNALKADIRLFDLEKEEEDGKA